MADYRLERLNEENVQRWEEFNKSSAEGSLFHGPEWKGILEKTFGEKAKYFLMFKDGDVVGLFPFVEHDIGPFKGLVPTTDPHRLPAIIRDYSDPQAMQTVIEGLRKVRIDGKKISFVCFLTLHEEPLNTITIYPLLPWADDGDMVLKLVESPSKRSGMPCPHENAG